MLAEETAVYDQILREAVGPIADPETATVVLNTLYPYRIGIREPDGIYDNESSIGGAAESVQDLYTGAPPLGHHEHNPALWRSFIWSAPSPEQVAQMEPWVQRLRNHPLVAYVKLAE